MKKLITLTGSSGSGKTTISQLLLNNIHAKFIQGCTTRKKRDSEVDDSLFTDKQSFQEMISDNEFIEWDEFNNNFYGTRKSILNEFYTSHYQTAIILLTQSGVLKLKKYIQQIYSNSIELHHFLLIPASLELLKTRILERDNNLNRFEVARKELADENSYCQMPPETVRITVESGEKALQEILEHIKLD